MNAQLRIAQTRYEKARDVLDRTRAEFFGVVVDLVESGDMTQADVARDLGMPRQQVHAILQTHGGR